MAGVANSSEGCERISVCFVLQNLSSGTLRYARDLTDGLSSRAVKVVLASLDTDYKLGGASSSHVMSLQIGRMSQKLVGRVILELLRLPLTLPKLIRIVLREKIDVLFTQNMDEGAFLCCLAGFVTRRPVVLFVQDLTDRELYVYERGFPKYAIPFLFSLARVRHTIVSMFSPRLFVASRFIQHEIREYSRNPIVVIPHGIRIPPSSPRKSKSETTHLVCVGNIEKKKGFEVPIKALALLRDLNVRLTIIGEGPIRSRLIELARSLGVADRADLPGFLDEKKMDTILGNADLGVVPSLWEGFGYATLEMMGKGLPVLASNAGALPEVVVPGVNGFLFKPGDFEGLAAVVRGLCSAPEELGNLAKGALETAREFSVERMIEMTQSGLEDVLGSPRLKRLV